MTTQHTPGPWRVGRAVNGNWIEAGHATMPKSIGRTFYTDTGSAIEDANARLIAAAPDLLEALDAVRRVLPGTLKQHDLFEAVEDAIATATGAA